VWVLTSSGTHTTFLLPVGRGGLLLAGRLSRLMSSGGCASTPVSLSKRPGAAAPPLRDPCTMMAQRADKISKARHHVPTMETGNACFARGGKKWWENGRNIYMLN